MLLSIRYSPLSASTGHILTFIGKDMKLGNAKHIPERNYDDVLDAWEELFKTKKINGVDCASADLFKGGNWSGKHVLSLPPNIMEKVNSWDRSKAANTDAKIVLGEFYDEGVKAQEEVPEVVDDLGIGEAVDAAKEIVDVDRVHKYSDVHVTVSDKVIDEKPKKKVKKKKKEEEIGA